MNFNKWERVLTPSGLSDNGKWKLGELKVAITFDVLKEAVVEEKNFFVGMDGGQGMDGGYRAYVKGMVVTVFGQQWFIEYSDSLAKMVGLKKS
jgi:hypothetical protein